MIFNFDSPITHVEKLVEFMTSKVFYQTSNYMYTLAIGKLVSFTSKAAFAKQIIYF